MPRNIRPLKAGEHTTIQTGHPGMGPDMATEYTATVRMPDGSFALIPTIWVVDGQIKRIDPSMARNYALMYETQQSGQTGQKLIFPRASSPEELAQYAQQRSDSGGVNNGPLIGPAPTSSEVMRTPNRTGAQRLGLDNLSQSAARGYKPALQSPGMGQPNYGAIPPPNFSGEFQGQPIGPGQMVQPYGAAIPGALPQQPSAAPQVGPPMAQQPPTAEPPGLGVQGAQGALTPPDASQVLGAPQTPPTALQAPPATPQAPGAISAIPPVPQRKPDMGNGFDPTGMNNPPDEYGGFDPTGLPQEVASNPLSKAPGFMGFLSRVFKTDPEGSKAAEARFRRFQPSGTHQGF